MTNNQNYKENHRYLRCFLLTEINFKSPLPLMNSLVHLKGIYIKSHKNKFLILQ